MSENKTNNRIKEKKNIQLLNDEDQSFQNQFHCINQIIKKPSHQQQQQIMIITQPNQDKFNQFNIDQFDTQINQNKHNHDLLKQFQQIKFNNGQCNLMDMEMQVQNVIKPTSQLTGYDYQKFLENRCILVQSPQLINQGYVTSYKLYQIKTKLLSQQQFATCVSRRFSDFQYLNQLLIQSYGGYIIPILPQKNWWAIINLEGKQYREVRTKSLNKFLNRLLKHKKLRYCRQLQQFLFEDDEIFSMRKGEYTQKKGHLQQKIRNIGVGAFEYGKSLYNKIISFNSDKETSVEQIRLTKNKLTKQDLTLSEYQIVVSQLIRITKELKLLVQNTIEQMKRLEEIRGLFSIGLGDIMQKSEIGLLRGTKIKEQSVNSSESMMIKIQNDNLYEQFEDMCEFIQSCYSAIQRRKNLCAQIQSLKQQEVVFSQKYKNSPRSTQLDIVRSKLNKLNKANQNYAQQLIKELQFHADQSKGMLKCFVQKFQKLKGQFFSMGID